MNEGRWDGIVRPYGPDEVERLRPSVLIQHTLAIVAASDCGSYSRRWLIVNSLGALTGNQAVQQVQAG